MRDNADPFTIRDLGPDEIIMENGFYRIPMERHHGQPCVTPERLEEIKDGDTPKPGEWSVTSSVLRDVVKHGPASVYQRSLLNPNREPKPETDALRLGRIMAAYIENGPEGIEEFVRVVASKPDSMTVPEMIEWAKSGRDKPFSPPARPSLDAVMKWAEGKGTPAAKRAIEYWRDIDSDPRMIVKEHEWETICEMGKALAADPKARAVMDGVPEITMAWLDEETGIWCLSRPDTVSFSGITTDYKKMSAQGRVFNGNLVDHRITDFRYDMQGAFACQGFEVLTEARPSFGIIAQSDVAPYKVVLREISTQDLHMGQFDNMAALKTYHQCMIKNDWTDEAEDVGEYRRPQWMTDQIMERMVKAEAA